MRVWTDARLSSDGTSARRRGTRAVCIVRARMRRGPVTAIPTVQVVAVTTMNGDGKLVSVTLGLLSVHTRAWGVGNKPALFLVKVVV